nr:hypothetical protein [Desulfobacterales bacterium]
MNEIAPDNYQSFLKDIKERIISAQYEALRAVNKKLASVVREISWTKNIVIIRTSIIACSYRSLNY